MVDGIESCGHVVAVVDWILCDYSIQVDLKQGVSANLIRDQVMEQAFGGLGI